MDKSKVLQQMADSADLLGMVEEMLGQVQQGRISPVTLSGMRITLRNARRAIVDGHGVFADQLVQSATGSSTTNSTATNDESTRITPLAAQIERDVTYENGNGTSIPLTEAQRLLARKKDLRASLEKIVERA